MFKSQCMLLAVALCAACLAVGCQLSPPAPDVLGQIAEAAPEGGGLVFHVEAQPINGNAAAAGTLDQQEAIRLAVLNDPELQSALAAVRMALADAQQARLLPNPVLDIVLRYPESGGGTIVDAGLSADLIALLKLPRARAAADHRLRSASARAVGVALDSVLAVQETWVAVQSLEAEVQILRQRQQINRRLLDVALARVRAGESSRLESLTLEAQRAEVQTELIQKLSQLTDQRLQLARLIGHPSLGLDWQLPAWQPPAAVTGTEGDWVAAALARRPEIQSAQWHLAALGDEAAIAGLGFLQGAAAGVSAERDGDWSVGPSVLLPLPIFDTGVAHRRRAEAEVMRARHAFTVAQRRVVEDVRRAWASLHSANEALQTVQKELLPAQQRRHEQAEIAWRNGSADITTFLQSEQDLQASRAKLIEVQRDVSLAAARLRRSVGGSGVAAELSTGAVPATTSTTVTP